MISTVSTATFKKLPGVLSFQRAYNVTDGEMFNQMPDGQLCPVEVVRHGIRGTQNVAEGAGKTAKTGDRAVSNPQVTETAKLHPEAVALVVRFSFRSFDLACTLSACASDDRQLMTGLRASVQDFVSRAKSGRAVDDLAARYARNIANGRWLWRNRIAAKSVVITVRYEGKEIAQFDAFSIPLNRFDQVSAQEGAVAAVLAAGFRGEPTSGLEVIAEIDFGTPGAVEVFPSQNYIEKERKPKGFARPLYKIGGSVQAPSDFGSGFSVVGHAALRDQKISNALRTFDTWYPSFAEVRRPIPIEPNGASLDLMDFMRDGTTAAFKLFTRLNQIDPASNEGLYSLACMIRGGVYSDSDKPKEPPANSTAQVTEEVS